MWVKNREKTLKGRRPNTKVLDEDEETRASSSVIVALMHECWKDEPSNRPHFAKVVESLQSVSLPQPV